MARPRARLVSLLVALPIFAALATGCLLWYAASDPLGDISEAAPCTASQKLCVGKCYEQTDPSVGCSGECSACDLPANGQAACVLRDASEVCAFGTCNALFADCDHDAGDGCEIETTQSPNCGGCGITCNKFCAPGGGSYACSDQCDASLCGTGCDHDSGDGCLCVDLQNDPNNCGTCGHSCTTVINGTGTCDAGGCNYACGATKCYDATKDKCVTTDFSASPNCGACGVTCTGVAKCCPKNGSYACSPSFTASGDGATGGVCNP